MTVEDSGSISDGYHTFDELYDHRNLLFITLCLEQPDCCYWNNNGDYDGCFCLHRDTPNGDVSYHIPNDYFPLIEDAIKYEDIPWDGHTSSDVINRLKKLSLILQGKDS